jgi:hypothetical protein
MMTSLVLFDRAFRTVMGFTARHNAGPRYVARDDSAHDGPDIAIRHATAHMTCSARYPGLQSRRLVMAQCEVCGNDYYLSFEVIAAGNRHIFDSFECAIQRLAPVCDHCGCKIIGHGIEANGTFFCCAHCARSRGVRAAVDHVGVAAESGIVTSAQ